MSAEWKPTLYLAMRAQTPMGVQADLFGSIAPGTAPAVCAHRYDPCAQLTMTGEQDQLCTICGERKEYFPVFSQNDKENRTMNYQDDIPSSLSGAYNWLSQHPERRFQQTRADYATTLEQDCERFELAAKDSGTRALVPAELARYREGLRKRWTAAIASDSRCASSFITGPANFPARRMQKRNDIAGRRWSEVFEYRKRAVAAILRTLQPELAPIMASDSDAAERLTAKIAELEYQHTTMKAEIAATRPKLPPLCNYPGEGFLHFTATEWDARKRHRYTQVLMIRSSGEIGSHRVRSTIHNGGNLGTCSKGVYITDAKRTDPPRKVVATEPSTEARDKPPQAWELSNLTAEIRRCKQRLEQITKAQATPETTRDGINARLQDCPADNRVRLFFPGKPADEVRAALKKHGFRWSPTIGAWQAYRNTWSILFANQMVGAEVSS